MKLTKEEMFEVLSKRAYDIGYELKYRHAVPKSVFAQSQKELLDRVELFYKDCSKALTDAD